MSRRKMAMGAVVVGAVGFFAGQVFSQDAKPAEGAKGPTPEQMKAWQEMSTPAEQNKQLAATAGTWDAVTKMQNPMDPAGAWIESKGVSTRRAALNNLYVLSEEKGEMMGQPFEGFLVNGYSKEKAKYFSFWIDQMGTTPMMLWGTADASGKKVTFDGDLYECAGCSFTPRIIVTNEDADHSTMEMWNKMEGAADYAKAMEIKYTRRK
jgi:hypothetical protein